MTTTTTTSRPSRSKRGSTSSTSTSTKLWYFMYSVIGVGVYLQVRVYHTHQSTTEDMDARRRGEDTTELWFPFLASSSSSSSSSSSVLSSNSMSISTVKQKEKRFYIRVFDENSNDNTDNNCWISSSSSTNNNNNNNDTTNNWKWIGCGHDGHIFSVTMHCPRITAANNHNRRNTTTETLQLQSTTVVIKVRTEMTAKQNKELRKQGNNETAGKTSSNYNNDNTTNHALPVRKFVSETEKGFHAVQQLYHRLLENTTKHARLRSQFVIPFGTVQVPIDVLLHEVYSKVRRRPPIHNNTNSNSNNSEDGSEDNSKKKKSTSKEHPPSVYKKVCRDVLLSTHYSIENYTETAFAATMNTLSYTTNTKTKTNTHELMVVGTIMEYSDTQRLDPRSLSIQSNEQEEEQQEVSKRTTKAATTVVAKDIICMYRHMYERKLIHQDISFDHLHYNKNTKITSLIDFSRVDVLPDTSSVKKNKHHQATTRITILQQTQLYQLITILGNVCSASFNKYQIMNRVKKERYLLYQPIVTSANMTVDLNNCNFHTTTVTTTPSDNTDINTDTNAPQDNAGPASSTAPFLEVPKKNKEKNPLLLFGDDISITETYRRLLFWTGATTCDN